MNRSSIINAAFNHFGKQLSSLEPPSDVGLAFFYFDFSHGLKTNTSTMLRSLIHQLLKQLSHVPQCIRDMRSNTPADDDPDTHELLDCLIKLCRSFRSTAIFVDALDEASPVIDALAALQDMSKMLPYSTRCIVTSRDEIVIKRVLTDANFQQIHIPRTSVDRDIMSYVVDQSKTDMKGKFDSFPQDLRKEVISTLTSQSQGM